MSEKAFEELVTLALNLSPIEKARLLERVASILGHDLESPEATPGISLYGLWSDLETDISEEDNAEARREAWANFPREDI
jgi:hypothetical protein